MFDSEDREQDELDYEYVVKLRRALAKAIEEADGWYDDSTGRGSLSSLDEGRRLLKADIE